MRHPAIFLLLLCCSFYCSAQVPFKQVRYDEDYSFLKNDTINNWYKKMKYRSLSGNGRTYLSLGGDIRYQYLYIKNENWESEPKDNDGFILTRYLTHADLRMGKNFRAFAELQSSFVNSRSFLVPVENSSLDLHQAFIDVTAKQTANSSLMFRLGRQELLYGSQRLISVKDAPNTRQSFDGLKSMFVSGNYEIDLFYSHYVENKVETFDDGFSKNTKFWGLYLTRKNVPALQNVDLYYLGLWKRQAGFDDGTGKEMRHTFGGRLSGEKRNWKYDLEGIYQSGKFESKRIDAWSVSLITSYAFNNLKFKPEIGLKTELISGDKNYDDKKLQTLNPLFPQGAYFGLAVGIGPVNLADIHPSLVVKLNQKISLGIDHAVIWRYSRNDGIYRPNITLAYSGRGISDKYIGGQLSGTFFYLPNQFINFISGFSWFDAGGYLKNAGGGKDVLFGFGSIQLKF